MSAPASFWETVQIFNDAECDELLAALGRLPSGRDVAFPVWVTPVPPPKFQELYVRLLSKMAEVNNRTWRYTLDGYLEVQQLKYEAGDEYPFHTDLQNPQDRGRQRKLALSVLLSPPDAFVGGELEIQTGVSLDKLDKSVVVRGPAFIAPLSRRGSGVLFPSFLIHRITPVTRGTRVVLVGRAGGPAFT